MSIYFNTHNDFDFDVIRVMGVSVKNGNNPIGYFGTGLKYAIATLLRTNHKISMIVDGKSYKFTARPTKIRGEEFEVVYMNDEKLPFTTSLGRNWKPWMAYRELYSNTLDEDGQIGYASIDSRVIIKVTGDGIENAHAKRSEIFLTNPAVHIGNGFEVYSGASRFIYYRGVKAGELNIPSVCTYNITSPSELTEDRTLKSDWDWKYILSTGLPKINDTNLWERVFDFTQDRTFELGLNLEFCKIQAASEAYRDVLMRSMTDARIPESLRVVASELKGEVREEFKLTNAQYEQYEEAKRILERIDPMARDCKVNWVKELGPNIYGCVRDGKIYVAEQTISNGPNFLAITLYEEWIHQRFGHKDCTLGMQQYLFDKILAMASEK